MPALSLDLILDALLPWLSPEGCAALRAMVAASGEIDADSLARKLGLANRFQLNRLLKREGLPSFGALSDWISVLALTLESETTGGVAASPGLDGSAGTRHLLSPLPPDPRPVVA